MQKENLIINSLDQKSISRISLAYEQIILTVLDEILRRYEADPDYPFINTKIDLISGEDFSSDDRIKGKNTVYSWIQSRGLEALAVHACWIQNSKHLSKNIKNEYATGITKLLAEVMEKMEKIRSLNNGHIPCMMTVEGKPLKPASADSVEELPFIEASPSTLSDLFYMKGVAEATALLLSASALPMNSKLPTIPQAEIMFDNIITDLFCSKFVFDQKSLDPKNKINTDCILEGGFMISIGGAASFLKLTQNPKYWHVGMKLIKHIIKKYVNTEAETEYGKQFDMWEEVDRKGIPLSKSETLRSDPGHAIEFTGLSFKLIHIAQNAGIIRKDDPEILEMIQILKGIIRVNFANGFAKYGIVKSFDIATQQIINSDMPWWSLPETIRAANFANYYSSQNDRTFEKIFIKSSNAFAKYYLNENLFCMAYQTLNENAKVIKTIPATPDADPGYHTNLSLIDAIGILNTNSENSQ